MDDSRRHEDEEELPTPIEMDDQGASYGSSYTETEPGQVTANRRNALQDQPEAADGAEQREG
jgi:hypothetical protein